ncbi:hypothetical protein ACIPJS_38580 [Streptomyces sp. NPDC086783]|uniref:hypothetical protein n=1 Tax=Streptomyces sp. NPDC086783 TaxID=3365758 RepID=UPI00382F0123
MTYRSFPPDLVALHEAYTRTYQALAHAQPGQSAWLRRDLVRLQARLLAHPYWAHRLGSPAAGWALLREQLREEEASMAGRRAG